MVAMVGGWYLCSSCWIDGVLPMNQIRPPSEGSTMS